MSEFPFMPSYLQNNFLNGTETYLFQGQIVWLIFMI